MEILTPEQKANVQKLVDELRTTKKRQGRGQLVTHVDRRKRYCCLGIACEVAVANGVNLKYDAKFGYTDPDYGDHSFYTLPRSVMGFYGFEDRDPGLIGEDGFNDNASSFNDENGYNFKRIADAFERTYLKPTKPEQPAEA